MRRPVNPLEQIIRPIVEGQIRGFCKEHPVIIEAVDWYKPRVDKTQTFVNSLSKRITRDLLCPRSRARMEEVFLAPSTEKTPKFRPWNVLTVAKRRLFGI